MPCQLQKASHAPYFWQSYSTLLSFSFSKNWKCFFLGNELRYMCLHTILKFSGGIRASWKSSWSSCCKNGQLDMLSICGGDGRDDDGHACVVVTVTVVDSCCCWSDRFSLSLSLIKNRKRIADFNRIIFSLFPALRRPNLFSFSLCNFLPRTLNVKSIPKGNDLEWSTLNTSFRLTGRTHRCRPLKTLSRWTTATRTITTTLQTPLRPAPYPSLSPRTLLLYLIQATRQSTLHSDNELIWKRRLVKTWTMTKQTVMSRTVSCGILPQQQDRQHPPPRLPAIPLETAVDRLFYPWQTMVYSPTCQPNPIPKAASWRKHLR